MLTQKKLEAKHEKIIRDLLKERDNRRCVDCENIGPQYAVIAFNVFVCTTCSGVHRQFGHRVKGISMSTFTAEEVAGLQNGGNQKFMATYAAKWSPSSLPRPTDRNPDRTRDWIQALYQSKKFFDEVVAASYNNNNKDSNSNNNKIHTSMTSPSTSIASPLSIPQGHVIDHDQPFSAQHSESSPMSGNDLANSMGNTTSHGHHSLGHKNNHQHTNNKTTTFNENDDDNDDDHATATSASPSVTAAAINNNNTTAATNNTALTLDLDSIAVFTLDGIDMPKLEITPKPMEVGRQAKNVPAMTSQVTPRSSSHSSGTTTTTKNVPQQKIVVEDEKPAVPAVQDTIPWDPFAPAPLIDNDHRSAKGEKLEIRGGSDDLHAAASSLTDNDSHDKKKKKDEEKNIVNAAPDNQWHAFAEPEVLVPGTQGHADNSTTGTSMPTTLLKEKVGAGTSPSNARIQSPLPLTPVSRPPSTTTTTMAAKAVPCLSPTWDAFAAHNNNNNNNNNNTSAIGSTPPLSSPLPHASPPLPQHALHTIAPPTSSPISSLTIDVRPEVPLDAFYPEFEQIRATGRLPTGQIVPPSAVAHWAAMSQQQQQQQQQQHYVSQHRGQLASPYTPSALLTPTNTTPAAAAAIGTHQHPQQQYSHSSTSMPAGVYPHSPHYGNAAPTHPSPHMYQQQPVSPAPWEYQQGHHHHSTSQYQSQGVKLGAPPADPFDTLGSSFQSSLPSPSLSPLPVQQQQYQASPSIVNGNGVVQAAAATATLYGATSLTAYDLSAPAAPKARQSGNPFA